MKHTLIISAALVLLAFASCNNATTSTETAKTDSTATKMESKTERNKKVVMASMNDGINGHDANKLMKDVAPDFVDYGDGSMHPMKADSAKQMMAEFLKACPDARADNVMYFADGDNVVVVSDYTMTFKNEMMGMKPTGKTAKFKDADIFTFDNNGKITSHRNIYPGGAMMMQMGCDMSKMQAMDKDKKKGDGKTKM